MFDEPLAGTIGRARSRVSFRLSTPPGIRLRLDQSTSGADPAGAVAQIQSRDWRDRS